MNERSAFSGGDQSYLRTVQYGDGTKLDVRTSLHRTYSSSPVLFPDFEAGLIEWSENAAVLECGSGTGRFWENALVPRSVSIVVSDLSPGMVDEAAERARANGFSRVVGRECDVQALPFEDESFDVVIANHMLYHVPDPGRAITELARVMRTDGVLIAGTNARGHMRQINEAIAEVFGSHGEQLDQVFGLDTGEARLREQFSSICWHAFDNDLVVDDPAAVVAYGLSFPPGESASELEEEQFAEAVDRRFVGGVLRIHTRAGVFVCSRPRRARIDA